MAEPLLPGSDWFSPESIRERMRGFYKERFTEFTKGLEFQKDPSLCNRFGFPVPVDWVLDLKQRKKDGLFIVKFQDYTPNRYLTGENDEILPDFYTLWAASYGGEIWYFGNQRKIAIGHAEAQPLTERMARVV